MPVFALSLPTKILIVLSIALALFGSGIYYGDEWAEGRHAKADLKAEQDYSKALLEGIAKQRKINADVTRDLEAEKRAREAQKTDFERRLRDAPRGTLVDIQDLGNEPPRNLQGASGAAREAAQRETIARGVRLSVAACRLWNSGLAQALTEAERTGWPAGDDLCAGPVEVEDALDSLGKVAGLLGQCRVREQRAQRFYVEEGMTQ